MMTTAGTVVMSVELYPVTTIPPGGCKLESHLEEGTRSTTVKDQTMVASITLVYELYISISFPLPREPLLQSLSMLWQPIDSGVLHGQVLLVESIP